jgi:hypothetical protein
MRGVFVRCTIESALAAYVPPTFVTEIYTRYIPRGADLCGFVGSFLPMDDYYPKSNWVAENCRIQTFKNNEHVSNLIGANGVGSLFSLIRFPVGRRGMVVHQPMPAPRAGIRFWIVRFPASFRRSKFSQTSQFALARC